MEAILQKLDAISRQSEVLPDLSEDLKTINSKLDVISEQSEFVLPDLSDLMSIKSDVGKLQISCDEVIRKLGQLERPGGVGCAGGNDIEESDNGTRVQPKAPIITYGVGMACSFFEGYLMHILPDDGSVSGSGLEVNIKLFESQQGIFFPVKSLFIVITKSLYCPPKLDHFNRTGSATSLESIESLDELQRDVAGVKARKYRNSVYKILREGRPGPGVPLVAEFATPLHTLYKVLQKRAVYGELCDVAVPALVQEFCAQLQRIVANSPECRGRCEIVHFDDERENLADVLLDKIKQLEPNFERIIAQGRRSSNF